MDATIRIGCGAVLGILVGLALIVSFFAMESGAVLTGVIVLSVVTCAILSYCYGDRFLHAAARWIRWFQ